MWSNNWETVEKLEIFVPLFLQVAYTFLWIFKRSHKSYKKLPIIHSVLSFIMLKLHPLNVYFFLFSVLYTFCYAIYFGERNFLCSLIEGGYNFLESFFGGMRRKECLSYQIKKFSFLALLWEVFWKHWTETLEYTSIFDLNNFFFNLTMNILKLTIKLIYNQLKRNFISKSHKTNSWKKSNFPYF